MRARILFQRLSLNFAAMLAGTSMIVAATANASVPATERAVLDAIYNSSGGPNSWNHREGWDGTLASECQNWGVTCFTVQGQEHVFRIDLNGNGLTGQLPQSLSDLPLLTNFDVSHNQLTGAIPALSGMTNLDTFDASFNLLIGEIPTLAALPSLLNFNVSFNQLIGPIPVLGGLTKLYSFEVEHNQLTGSIPNLTGLTKLMYFFVFDNHLDGGLPALTGLTNLKYFYAQFNQLNGELPALSGLTNLRGFDVSSNKLIGAIPDLTNSMLQYFNVDRNALTGNIPAAPATLQIASLCPNPLNTNPQPAIDPSWNLATHTTPWWATPFDTNECDDLFNDNFGS